MVSGYFLDVEMIPSEDCVSRLSFTEKGVRGQLTPLYCCCHYYNIVVALVIEPRVLCMLGLHSTPELHHQPL